MREVWNGGGLVAVAGGLQPLIFVGETLAELCLQVLVQVISGNFSAQVFSQSGCHLRR